MKKILSYCFVSLFFFLSMSAFAGSIQLINNTSYDLKAVISGNDNSQLGEVVIGKNSFVYWSDIPGERGYLGKPQDINKNSPYSRSPYRVVWLCMNGSEFAICEVVHTASQVTAKQCPGPQMCRPSEE